MMEKLRKISTMYYVRQIVACLLVYCILLAVPMQVALAAPLNPVQVAGDPIDPYSGLGSDITGVHMGSSSRAVINWDSLDTSSIQELHFLKDAGNFAVLNRVIAGGETHFDGSLFGERGDIFIVNTRGIVFGPESFIQARTFVASGIDISNRDFMVPDGEFKFEKNSSGYDFDHLIGDVTIDRTDVPVVTEGEIHAKEVALIGRNITNKGSIVASGRDNIVVMAAGDSVILSRDGSDVAVEVSLGYTRPAYRVVDNGGSQGTGDGTIIADDGKVILAAGDIWSTAIEGIESLRAEAKGDITLQGAIDASGHVEILGGQNRIISKDADININANITAGSMRIKNGNDTSGEQSESGIYVADGVTLFGTTGDVVIEAVHDIELGTGYVDPSGGVLPVVMAVGGIFLNADEDGYGNPKGAPGDYHPNRYGGGDLHAKGGIMAMFGDIDILGNDILLEDFVVTLGDLTITGSTSEDSSTGWGDVHAQSTLDAVTGTIEISGDDDTIYLDENVTAGVDLLLNNDTEVAGDKTLKAGQNVTLAPNKELTAQGNLTIEATGGAITARDIIMPAVPAPSTTLTLTQNDTMDMEFGTVWVHNRNNTDLVAKSTAGSVTSIAAAEWQSIEVPEAYDSIVLTDIGGDITTKVLNALHGNIEVTTDNLGQILAKDDNCS